MTFPQSPKNTFKTRTPMKILVSAGGTREPIDSVRVISNLSTGRTGQILAQDLSLRGHGIQLLLAQSASLSIGNQDSPMEVLRYETSDDLENLMRRQIENFRPDVVIHAAAVSDYQVKRVWTEETPIDLESLASSGGKISSDHSSLMIELTRRSKIISQIREWGEKESGRKIFLVGFKLTVGLALPDQMRAAQRLMMESRADLIVHNDWNQRRQGLHAQSEFRLFGQGFSTDGQLVQGMHSLVDSLEFQFQDWKKQSETGRGVRP